MYWALCINSGIEDLNCQRRRKKMINIFKKQNVNYAAGYYENVAVYWFIYENCLLNAVSYLSWKGQIKLFEQNSYCCILVDDLFSYIAEVIFGPMGKLNLIHLIPSSIIFRIQETQFGWDKKIPSHSYICNDREGAGWLEV